MQKQKDIIQSLADDTPVRVFLPLRDNEESRRISCVLHKLEAPHFTLIFLKGFLPADKLDLQSSVIVTLDLSGKVFSMEAKILEVVNDQTLKMVSQKIINHEQSREFFRVDCTFPIQLKSIVPEAFEVASEQWKITGTTVDLSGSGLRASFTSPPPENTQIRMEVALPTAVPTIVSVLASPMRITQLSDTLWDAAYFFDEVSDEDRDTIIGCCLTAQRRLLRLKVQVKDY